MPHKNLLHPASVLLMLLSCTLFLAGGTCISHTKPASLGRQAPVIREPSADGIAVYGSETVSVDASHIDEGYVMVRYGGDNAKVKLQLEAFGGQAYTYLLSRGGKYEVFPLSSGGGVYSLRVYENVKNDTYALVFEQELDVKLKNEFLPFLYPNQYVSFTPNSLAAAVGRQVCTGCAGTGSEADIVRSLYHYVTENISYDEEKAAQVAYGYLPDVDEVLASGKGICFDYAALLAALLRLQGIPAKLEVGYAGDVLHAWVSVYPEDDGWLYGVRLYGNSWNLLDPTLAACGGGSPLIGGGNEYKVKYSY